MQETKFYRCEICGNLVGMIHSSGVHMVCCGKEMTLLVPNTADTSFEKHLPVITATNGAVSVAVGSAAHPMVPEHYVQWVYLQTEKGGQRKNLNPGDTPAVVFALAGDKPIAAYAYCNLHGLWKTKI